MSCHRGLDLSNDRERSRRPKFVVRGGKTISFEGAPPAPRVVVIQFESLEKLQALYESAPYKQAVAIGDKYATQRIFGVEGVLP